MKMESMAQFLIKGDIILRNRHKYEVVNTKTKGNKTTILYKTRNSDVYRMLESNKSEFFKVISPVSLNGDDDVK